jgi:hypothetical protein
MGSIKTVLARGTSTGLSAVSLENGCNTHEVSPEEEPVLHPVRDKRMKENHTSATVIFFMIVMVYFECASLHSKIGRKSKSQKVKRVKRVKRVEGLKEVEKLKSKERPGRA